MFDGWRLIEYDYKFEKDNASHSQLIKKATCHMIKHVLMYFLFVIGFVALFFFFYQNTVNNDEY